MYRYIKLVFVCVCLTFVFDDLIFGLLCSLFFFFSFFCSLSFFIFLFDLFFIFHEAKVSRPGPGSDVERPMI